MSSGGDWNKRVAWAMECAILAQQVSTVQLLARTRLAISVPVRGWLAGLGWAGTANTGPEKGSGLFSSPPSGMLLRQVPSPICADSFPYELAPDGIHTVRKGGAGPSPGIGSRFQEVVQNKQDLERTCCDASRDSHHSFAEMLNCRSGSKDRILKYTVHTQDMNARPRISSTEKPASDGSALPSLAESNVTPRSAALPEHFDFRPGSGGRRLSRHANSTGSGSHFRRTGMAGLHREIRARPRNSRLRLAPR
jgi:hypothetical protein